MKQSVLPLLLATIWISLSEFVRNQFLLHHAWTEHYNSLGLTFPEEPINGAIWGLWSLIYASVLFILSKKFSLLQTGLLGWIIGFPMMWIVLGNLLILPFNILPLAIPLSLLESFGAAWIIHAIRKKFIARF